MRRIYFGFDWRYPGLGIYRHYDAFIWEEGVIVVVCQFGPWYLTLDLTPKRTGGRQQT